MDISFERLLQFFLPRSFNREAQALQPLGVESG